MSSRSFLPVLPPASTSRRRLSCFPLAKDGLHFGFMPVAEKPTLGFFVLLGQGRTGGNHHPERRFDIGGWILRPLPFGYQKVSEPLRRLLTQHGIEPGPECLILHRILPHKQPRSIHSLSSPLRDDCRRTNQASTRL